MRRSSVLAPVVALGAILSASFVPDATAQSFFQNLFGLGNAPAAAPRIPPPNRLGAPAHVTPAVQHERSSARAQSRASRDDTKTDEGTGRYHTYCVRTCDGYYFPISRAVPRRSFRKDALACKSRCGEEAKLFYGPVDSDAKAEMVDLTGLDYGDLPNAFKYRKTLIAGCACKPAPWSEAELSRHREYAVAEAEKAAGLGKVADARAAREPVKLPPPLSGPGVTIMSSGEAVVMGDSTAADNQGIGSLAAAETTPQAAAAPDAGVPQPEVKTAEVETREAVPRAEPVEPPVRRTTKLRRGIPVAMLNAGHQAAPRQPRHERQHRRQHHAQQLKPQVVAANGGGWFGGGSIKYVYPNNYPVSARR